MSHHHISAGGKHLSTFSFWSSFCPPPSFPSSSPLRMPTVVANDTPSMDFCRKAASADRADLRCSRWDALTLSSFYKLELVERVGMPCGNTCHVLLNSRVWKILELIANLAYLWYTMPWETKHPKHGPKT